MRACVVLVFSLLGGQAAAASLYDALGGTPGIDRLASSVIDIYLADPRLRPYFDDVNPAWLKPRFASDLCQLAGGPCVYHGRAMGPAHAGLHIDEAAFNVVAEDLQLAMRRQGIGFWAQNRLLAKLAPMERQIVTR